MGQGGGRSVRRSVVCGRSVDGGGVRPVKERVQHPRRARVASSRHAVDDARRDRIERRRRHHRGGGAGVEATRSLRVQSEVAAPKLRRVPVDAPQGRLLAPRAEVKRRRRRVHHVPRPRPVVIPVVRVFRRGIVAEPRDGDAIVDGDGVVALRRKRGGVDVAEMAHAEFGAAVVHGKRDGPLRARHDDRVADGGAGSARDLHERRRRRRRRRRRTVDENPK